MKSILRMDRSFYLFFLSSSIKHLIVRYLHKINEIQQISPFHMDFWRCKKEFLFDLLLLDHDNFVSNYDHYNIEIDYRIHFQYIFVLESGQMVRVLQYPIKFSRMSNLVFQSSLSSLTSVRSKDFTVIGPSYITTAGKRCSVR